MNQIPVLIDTFNTLFICASRYGWILNIKYRRFIKKTHYITEPTTHLNAQQGTTNRDDTAELTTGRYTFTFLILITIFFNYFKTRAILLMCPE